MEYLLALGLAMALNLAVFLLAYKKQTDKFTDVTYALTFIVIALFFYFACEGTLPMLLMVAMVALWAIRIGIYLGVRIHKIGRDKRFDNIRPHFKKYLGFWALQGLSVWIIMLPAMIFLEEMPPKLIAWSTLGVIVWFAGLVTEAIADQQKYNFLSNSKNKGKWIENGLWAYSRHPNYFGEILVWLGVFIFALPYLELWQSAIALIGPVWITVLLVFITGIPKAEAGAEARWGKLASYKAYKKRVPVLLPKRPL